MGDHFDLLDLCRHIDGLDSTEVAGVRMTALSRKNLFNTDCPGGYADVKYLILCSVGDVAVVAEVQVLLQSYFAVKQKMHAFYRIGRGDFEHPGPEAMELVNIATLHRSPTSKAFASIHTL